MGLDENVRDNFKIDKNDEESPSYQIVREVEEILAKEESSFMFKQTVESFSDYKICIYDLVDRDCLF